MKTGKWSDGDQWVQETAGEVRCRNRICLDQQCDFCVVRGEVDMLTKIELREKRQKLRGESVCRIIEMNVKVTGVVSAKSRKTENGLE